MRVTYLCGGARKLSSLLSFSDDAFKTLATGALKSANASLADQVLRSMVSLEVLGKMNAAAIQEAVKRSGTASFGAVLKTLPDSVQAHIAAALPKDLADRIRKDAETVADNPVRLTMEKRKVLAVLIAMKDEGSIA
jgi:flagellar motor switch protein FliG